MHEVVEVQFDETGQLAEEATRNELRVEIYMFLCAIQSVLYGHVLQASARSSN